MHLTLSKLGIKNGTQFDCDDFVQHLQFKLIIFHLSTLSAEEFEIVSAAANLSLTNNNDIINDETKQYDKLISSSRKRQSLFENDERKSPKRSRISE